MPLLRQKGEESWGGEVGAGEVVRQRHPQSSVRAGCEAEEPGIRDLVICSELYTLCLAP